MSGRFAFGSDTNLAAFEEWLEDQGLHFTVMGRTVYVSGGDGRVDDEALALGADVVSSDFSEPGAADAWSDAQATATRASPPDVIRGPPPPDYSAQIVSQKPGKLPARRKTWSQPS